MDHPCLVADGAGVGFAWFVVRKIVHAQHKHDSEQFSSGNSSLIIMSECSAQSSQRGTAILQSGCSILCVKELELIGSGGEDRLE